MIGSGNILSVVALLLARKTSSLNVGPEPPVGAAFTAVTLVAGSLWGRPTWGTWWEWDGRLTSMLVLLFLYEDYIALAQASDREGVSARIPAIFGLVLAVLGGSLLIPGALWGISFVVMVTHVPR